MSQMDGASRALRPVGFLPALVDGGVRESVGAGGVTGWA